MEDEVSCCELKLATVGSEIGRRPVEAGIGELVVAGSTLEATDDVAKVDDGKEGENVRTGTPGMVLGVLATVDPSTPSPDLEVVEVLGWDVEEEVEGVLTA